MTALSKKHQEFVNQYFLCNMNQTEAYLKVYPKSSYDAARAHATRLVADGNIQVEIQRRLKERQLSADEVLSRLGDMARADIADFADIERPEDLESDKHKGKTHVIKKFKRKVTRDSLGREKEEIELELYPADNALVNIGKQHGLFADKHVVDLKLEKEVDGILDVLERVLDPNNYQRALTALSGPEGGSAAVESDDTAESE
jgi:phage terminase small subunit